ncbi:MAG: hypothetical protein R2706_19605 [Acidimicrobiales bacterium]
MENVGHFPTNVTEQAVKKKICGPVVVELSVADGVALVGGERVQELGQLAGRERVRTP